MLRLSFFISLAFIMLINSGCMSMPQNPQEFRAQVRMYSTDKIVQESLNRPYEDIVKSWDYHAANCLKKRITVTEEHQLSTSTGYVDYVPNLMTSKNKTVLTLQVPNVSMGPSLTPPPSGAYILVADLIREENGMSQVTIYHGGGLTAPQDNVVKAIVAWSKGRSGCPDLTQ